MNFYCGMFEVVKIWNGKGAVVEEGPTPEQIHEQFTYLLRRLPQGPCNSITTQELFNKLQDGNGMRRESFKSRPPNDCTGIVIPDDSTSRSSSKRKGNKKSNK